MCIRDRYVTVQQPEVKFSATSWEELVNPILEDAVALKDDLHLTSEAPTLDDVTKETTYKIPSVETLSKAVSYTHLQGSLW